MDKSSGHFHPTGSLRFREERVLDFLRYSVERCSKIVDPSTNSNPDGRIISTTMKESTITQLKSLQDDNAKLKEKITQLYEVASRFYDCSSTELGGDIGHLRPFSSLMQKHFEDATFALQISGITDISLLKQDRI
ncbi:unnamed protein product [Fraxinus pennsylvanica]|uniref:Peptidyl-prolyl cis-trans isomerase n=1 Tax=Fraxinus pennsylvanica TaxID=56036 RepID=A0AAD1ZKY1_9LAMI|nr:unnamed protein product [Fraxinus pennsylvanica]